jgi:hypothetical protein
MESFSHRPTSASILVGLTTHPLDRAFRYYAFLFLFLLLLLYWIHSSGQHSSFEGYLIDPMNGSNRVIKEETETEMHSTETPYGR